MAFKFRAGGLLYLFVSRLTCCKQGHCIYAKHDRFTSNFLLFTSNDLLSEALPVFSFYVEWSGGAMVLGKLPAPEHLTNLDESKARAY